MTRARLTCDVLRCNGARRRGHRLCDRCYRQLPGELRVGIAEAHHQRRFADWTAMRRRAADLLCTDQARLAPAYPVTTPERAAQLRDRLLGESERTDA